MSDNMTKQLRLALQYPDRNKDKTEGKFLERSGNLYQCPCCEEHFKPSGYFRMFFASIEPDGEYTHRMRMCWGCLKEQVAEIKSDPSQRPLLIARYGDPL